jgi:hypothetical protein
MAKKKSKKQPKKMAKTLYTVSKEGPVTTVKAVLLDTGFGGFQAAAGIAMGVFVNENDNLGVITCLYEETIDSPCHGSVIHMTSNQTVHDGEVVFKLLQIAPVQPV